MRYFKAERKDGKEELYPAYTIEDFPIQNVSRETLRGKRKKEHLPYAKTIGAFDIETTTFINSKGKYEGFMYIWQFCVDGICVYGREWFQFMELLQILQDYLEARLVIYVHNLSFEFQFMRQILLQTFGEFDIFAVQKRKVLIMRNDRIEFRCSYKLSNMSLYAATKNELGCKYIKADGDLDYSIFRTRLTELDDIEFAYCMNDVLALYSYIIAKMVNESDTIATIPYTSTGYVRRDCRIACKKSKKYLQKYNKQKMNPNVYKLLKEASRGGDTGANRYLTGAMCAEVDSYDVVSSYPFQMLTQYYPSSRFYKFGNANKYELEKLCQEYCVIFRVAFTNLKAKKDKVDLYLSVSKKIGFAGKYKNCNGRVMKAACMAFTLTEIDWNIIKDVYTWESIAISDVYYAKRDMLPEELRNVILDYFVSKCKLAYQKDLLDESLDEYINVSYLYAKSKNRLNGIFGMCYTDPVRDIITINSDGEWKEEKAEVASSLKKFYNNKNNFLVYAWGCWTTAHARKHLNRLINLTGEGTIYWDTDSDKGMFDEVIKRKIEEENNKIIKLCEEKKAYADVNGKRFYLGIYEHETEKKPYQLFKTLGAKKYAYVDYKGELHCTISGVAKSKSFLHPDGARELKTIDNFDIGFIFKEAGGNTLYYNSQPWQKKTIGGVEHWTGDNVGISSSTYEIGITKEYAEILGYSVYKDKKI